MTWKLLVINDDPYLKTLYGTQIAKIKEQWEKGNIMNWTLDLIYSSPNVRYRRWSLGC